MSRYRYKMYLPAITQNGCVMITFKGFRRLLLIKRYAQSSIDSYIGLLLGFQKHVGVNQPLETIETFKLYNRIITHVEQAKYGYSSQKQLLAALRLYFLEIHKKEIDFAPVYPTSHPRKLPVILSQQEVKKNLDTTSNVKHKAMLTTIYALGLRSGELINLKLSDVLKDRKLIHIKAAKGNKDRILPLPDKLREVWEPYYRKHRPNTYLFEGQRGNRYSANSLLKVFKTACLKAGVSRDHTIHSLRHAYATHLFDRGTDIRMIQKLLGHDSIKTTLIYTQVSRRSMIEVRSPLDDL